MDTRQQHYQTLHARERHLFEFIESREVYDAETTLDAIIHHPLYNENRGPKLIVVDHENKSFLYLAIELWEQINNHRETLTRKSAKEGNTLVNFLVGPV